MSPPVLTHNYRIKLKIRHGLCVAAHLGKTAAEIAPTLEATLCEVTACAPGISRTWNESWYPVQGDRGEIIGFSAMVVDITERKQAEAALHGNTALFYKIIEQAPGGVYVVDAQFRLAQVNAERCRLSRRCSR